MLAAVGKPSAFNLTPGVFSFQTIVPTPSQYLLWQDTETIDIIDRLRRQKKGGLDTLLPARIAHLSALANPAEAELSELRVLVAISDLKLAHGFYHLQAWRGENWGPLDDCINSRLDFFEDRDSKTYASIVFETIAISPVKIINQLSIKRPSLALSLSVDDPEEKYSIFSGFKGGNKLLTVSENWSNDLTKTYGFAQDPESFNSPSVTNLYYQQV